MDANCNKGNSDRYEEKLIHHGGIQTLGQGPREDVGSPSLEAFRI